MEWEKVDSRQINAISYSAETKVLYVEFKGGSAYRYFSVPQEMVNDFRGAESKGTFLGKHIKSTFRFEKLEPIVELKPAIVSVVDELVPLEKDLQFLDIRTEALELKKIENIEIATRASFLLSLLKDLVKVIEAKFEKPVRKAHEAHKELTEWRGRELKEVSQPVDHLTELLLTYETEQERIIAAKREQERLRAEAEERARREKEEAERKERQRLEDERIARERAQIEKERNKLAEETAAQEAALRSVGMKEEAELARKRAEADAYLAQVMQEAVEVERKLQRDKEEREAQESLSRPIYTPTVPIVEAKVEGFTVAKIWKGKVVDMQKLLRAIVSTRPELIDCIQINQKFIDQMAKAHKKEDFGVPGVIGVPNKSGRSN
jgi:hypothetical protein